LNGWAIDLAGPCRWLSRAVFRGAGAIRLHSRNRTSDRCDGAGRCDEGGTALVYVVELLAVLCGLALVLNLRGHGRNAGAAIGCDLGRLRAYVDAATATVVGDAVDGRVVHDDRAVVDVRDPRDVDVVDGAVVVKVMTLPVATVIAATGIAIAVVNSAVEADVRTPEAAMQNVAATEEAPVGGSPKSTVEGRSAPCTGNPVVADGCICPVAGGP
jgi:hypothetical protein